MTAPAKTLWETRKLEETLMRKSQAKLRLATNNVGTLIGKNAEVTETVGSRVDVIALQEVRYKIERVQTLKRGDFKHRLYRKGKDTFGGPVFVKPVIDVKRISRRIFISVELVLSGKW